MAFGMHIAQQRSRTRLVIDKGFAAAIAFYRSAHQQRLARLDTLPELRRRAEPVWAGLRETSRSGFEQFAAEVRKL